MLTAVTGINWGDEGKGRVIDLLAEQADVVVRYQGGNNAGHTVVTTQGKFVLNLLPSGILHPGVVCVLGDGMVVDLEHLSQEIHEIEKKGIRVTPDHLKLSKRATVSMPWHGGFRKSQIKNHAGGKEPGACRLLSSGANVLPCTPYLV